MLQKTTVAVDETMSSKKTTHALAVKPRHRHESFKLLPINLLLLQTIYVQII